MAVSPPEDQVVLLSIDGSEQSEAAVKCKYNYHEYFKKFKNEIMRDTKIVYSGYILRLAH